MIPTTIHQIWWQGEENISPELNRYREAWISKNPDFQYNLWDEKKISYLVNESYQSISKLFHELKYDIQRIDISKYLIMHKHGGVYIDIDIEPIKRIVDLAKDITKPTFFNTKIGINWIEKVSLRINGIEPTWFVNNGALMSPIKSDIWMKIVNVSLSISNEARISRINHFWHIFDTTGPFLLTKFLQNQNTNDFNLMDARVSEPCFPTEKCEPDAESYMIHHHQLSWLSKEKLDVQTSSNIVQYSIVRIYAKVRKWIDKLPVFCIFCILAYYSLCPRKHISSY